MPGGSLYPGACAALLGLYESRFAPGRTASFWNGSSPRISATGSGTGFAPGSASGAGGWRICVTPSPRSSWPRVSRLGTCAGSSGAPMWPSRRNYAKWAGGDLYREPMALCTEECPRICWRGWLTPTSLPAEVG